MDTRPSPRPLFTLDIDAAGFFHPIQPCVGVKFNVSVKMTSWDVRW